MFPVEGYIRGADRALLGKLYAAFPGRLHLENVGCSPGSLSPIKHPVGAWRAPGEHLTGSVRQSREGPVLQVEPPNVKHPIGVRSIKNAVASFADRGQLVDAPVESELARIRAVGVSD